MSSNNGTSDSQKATPNGTQPEQEPEQGGGIFSSTQGFTLPPESWYLVQDDLTKSELKVTLCILLNYFQIGIDAEPLTFTDILNQTNLSRSSVLAGIEAALERKSIIRTTYQKQPRYEPRFGKIRTHDMTCFKKHVPKSEPSNQRFKTCHVSEIEPRQKIFDQLLKYGLAYHVAENIAMTNRYSLERLENQIAYIDYEVENGLAPEGLNSFPGYVVNRIKFDRKPPPSYKAGNGDWYDGYEHLVVR